MKERLDIPLVNRNPVKSREKAKTTIISGVVHVGGQKEDKTGTTFGEVVFVEIRGTTLKYVSHGGLKLEKAMTHFGVTLGGKICMGVGSSIGGFTDCMLQNNAAKMHVVDVEHGQLVWRLHSDERAVCTKKTDIRYVAEVGIPDRIQFSSIDVSFISLTKVSTSVKALLADDGQIVCLIKPQFEAGREKVGKRGVVRERSTHLGVIERVIVYAQSIGFGILNLGFSPIRGSGDNIEYLLHLQDGPERYLAEAASVDAKHIIDEVHGMLQDGDVSQTGIRLTKKDIY